jgi:glycosyltransferase involved in cell wall biosynthesis
VPLRICHIISGDLWAGAEVMAFHLLAHLNREPGVEILAVLLNAGRLAEELANAGVPTCILDESRVSFPTIVRDAAQSVRNWAPHILHSHRYKENLLAFLVSLALRDKAVLVSTQHGMPELYGGRHGLLRQMKLRANNLLLVSRFDKTVAVSDDLKRSLVRDYSFPERRLETIRNGIVIPEPRNRTRGKLDLVIGSAGRFVAVKDYPLMVEVAKEVISNNSNVRFEFAGDGPMLRDIQLLINRNGLQDRIALKGFVSDLSTFYGGLDLFLNTSMHEGIPMSVLEAMAFGVPPVVPRVGGLQEIIEDSKDGYLVGKRSPVEFADKCLALCKDETLRRSVAQAARAKIISGFSVERMVRSYLNMYKRIVEKDVTGVTPHDVPEKSPSIER